MITPDVEPVAAPWRVRPWADVVEQLLAGLGAPARGPRLLAVAGRSAGGKSTLAARLAAPVRLSCVA